VHLVPPGMTLEMSTLLGEIPLFNEDLLPLEPSPVARLRQAVVDADALLIVTPEYNGGVPGVLKNAFDWLSLPLGRSCLQDKPVAIMGATPGRLGTARAQIELRNALMYSASSVVGPPEVLLSHAHRCFDHAGGLVDEQARQLVIALFDRLAHTVRRARFDDRLDS
jgi:chromate reductase, NAD(P)H dehydrogenase (quinone)